MTKITKEEMQKALDPMVEKLLKMAKNQVSKEKLQNYTFYFKFLPNPNRQVLTHFALDIMLYDKDPNKCIDPFTCNPLSLSTMKDNSTVFEIYRENVRKNYTDSEGEKIWEQTRIGKLSSDYHESLLVRRISDQKHGYNIDLKPLYFDSEQAEKDYLKLVYAIDTEILNGRHNEIEVIDDLFEDYQAILDSFSE